MKTRPSLVLPHIARRQLKWFERYVRFYLRRNFHALHLLRLTDLRELEDRPVLVCLNHPSWWDPLVALYLSQRFFKARLQYAPIAAHGLAKYRFFERLGFFGIEESARKGAARFLRIGEAVLSQPSGVFWVTPQGAFTDVRRRPVVVEPGAGHLAHRLKRFAMLPLALEYTFWNERFAEAFACFGHPVFIDDGARLCASDWSAHFASALEATQNALSGAVERRDANAFEPLIKGGSGVGGVYDVWRACKARLQGRSFQPEHGSD